MSESLEFADLNFKLAVTQVLMYDMGLVLPKFCLREFVKTHGARRISIDADGYNIIPEVLSWFQELVIPVRFAKDVTEIYQDGNEIYRQIFPFWDGECDSFNIRSVDDAKHFPNLKSVTTFFDDDEANGIVSKFNAIGIQAQYL